MRSLTKKMNRFGEVLVHPSLQACFAVAFHGMRGLGDDRNVSSGPAHFFSGDGPLASE
jgi:hypothetical protein